MNQSSAGAGKRGAWAVRLLPGGGGGLGTTGGETEIGWADWGTEGWEAGAANSAEGGVRGINVRHVQHQTNKRGRTSAGAPWWGPLVCGMLSAARLWEGAGANR